MFDLLSRAGYLDQTGLVCMVGSLYLFVAPFTTVSTFCTNVFLRSLLQNGDSFCRVPLCELNLTCASKAAIRAVAFYDPIQGRITQ